MLPLTARHWKPLAWTLYLSEQSDLGSFGSLKPPNINREKHSGCSTITSSRGPWLSGQVPYWFMWACCVTRSPTADDPFGVNRDGSTRESIVTCLLYFFVPWIRVSVVSQLFSLCVVAAVVVVFWTGTAAVMCAGDAWWEHPSSSPGNYMPR
jgi:hypothetical protein